MCHQVITLVYHFVYSTPKIVDNQRIIHILLITIFILKIYLAISFISMIKSGWYKVDFHSQ